jgi:hypothetical protein
MSKCPTPWTFVGGILQDRDENAIAQVYTDDPETRAVLLHAGEMWKALNELTSVEPGSAAHRHADAKCCELARKIEAEIAAGRKP